MEESLRASWFEEVFIRDKPGTRVVLSDGLLTAD